VVPPDSLEPYDPYDMGDIALSGPVLDAGTGEPPDHCFDQAQIEPWGTEIAVDDAWWLRVADGEGTERIVGVWLPDGPSGPAVGDEIAGEMSYRPGMFGPTVGWIELRDAAGALIAWVGTGGDLRDLELPSEVKLDRGAVAGRDSSQCVAWESYDLDAAVDGDAGVLPYGGAEVFGGLELRHGGYDEQTSDSRCPDAFVARVTVAIAPPP
jgi:hypothetical protein